MSNLIFFRCKKPGLPDHPLTQRTHEGDDPSYDLKFPLWHESPALLDTIPGLFPVLLCQSILGHHVVDSDSSHFCRSRDTDNPTKLPVRSKLIRPLSLTL